MVARAKLGRYRRRLTQKNGDATETTLGDVVRAIVNLGERMEAGQAHTNARIDQTNSKLDALAREVRGLSGNVATMMRRLIQHDERLRRLERRPSKPPRVSRRR